MKLIFVFFMLVLLLSACRREPTPQYEDDPADIEISTEDKPEDYYPNDLPPEILPEIPPHNDYIISLDINPHTRTVSGMSRVVFTNRSYKPLTQILFSLPHNAFREDADWRPFFPEHENSIFRHGYAYSKFDILHISINDELVYYTICGTILTIELTQEILPHETVWIVLQFYAYIPMIAHRTGANEYAIWFGSFLPMLSFDGVESHIIGTQLFLETANFIVDITTPAEFIVAGTGLRSEEINVEAETKITRFEANLVRDFGFAVSAYFANEYVFTESGIRICLYYYSDFENVARFLEYARQIVEYFEYHIGFYPFRSICIIETDMFSPGVESSGIAFMNSDTIRQPNIPALAHTLGRQWFFNIVGYDPIREAWLGKGITRYLRARFVNDNPEELRVIMERERLLIAHRTDLYMTDSSYMYASWWDFFNTHYRKSMLMFYALHCIMGDYFWVFIDRFYHTFFFGIASGEDFMLMAEEVYGESLEEFFYSWIFSSTVPMLPLSPSLEDIYEDNNT